MNLNLEGTMTLRRFDVLALLGLLTALTFGPLSAQRTSRAEERTSDVQEGEWVRLTFNGTEDQVIEGSFQGIEEDDLLILSPEGREVSRIPMGQVRGFEVRRESGTQAFKGLGFGLLAGAVCGALFGLSDGDDDSGFLLFTAEEKAAMGALGGGLIGGAIGLAIGHAAKTDRWERASLPVGNPSVHIAPNGRLGVGFSIPTRR